MNGVLQQSLWQQFGASINMLENAITMCPDELWPANKFWYNAFHCLFFLDYYLTPAPAGFAPPPPFTLSEFEDVMPDRIYTKHEILSYLEFCRQKAEQLILNQSEWLVENTWTNESKTMIYPVIEIMLYNMRHVQHHAAQLNLLLRQHINDAPDWVSRAAVKP